MEFISEAYKKKKSEVVEEAGRGGRADGFAESKNVPRLEMGGSLKDGLGFIVCLEAGGGGYCPETAWLSFLRVSQFYCLNC